jgi:hypothetical protein
MPSHITVQRGPRSRPAGPASAGAPQPRSASRGPGKWLAAVAMAALPGNSLAAQAPASGEARPEKIRDNLFLLEEAYNQEPGVIQHIQWFMFTPRTKSWAYNFTQEWPVPTDLNQLSITVPISDPGESERTALGDVLLNYRLQAVGAGGAGWLAMAPRFSLVLPTGNYRRGTGRGVLGTQLNLPVSIELGDSLVTHLNGGLTITPGARSPDGYAQTAVDTNLGAALVWLPLTWANPLVEVAHLTVEEIQDERTSDRRSTFVVNPGIRFAITFDWGLQIVPGISAPIEFSDGNAQVSTFFYLSFEHVVWKASEPPEREGE